MRRCSQCNAELAEGAQFCPHCGTRAGTAPSPPAPPATGADDTLQQLHEAVRGLRAQAERLTPEAMRQLIADNTNPLVRDLQTLTQRVDHMALERQRLPMTDGGRSVPDQERIARRTAFFAALRHGLQGMPAEQRALVEDATGQILVPEDLDAEIYRALPRETVIRGLATVRTTNRDRIRRRSLTEVLVGWGKLETGGTLVEGTATPAEEFMYVEDQVGLTKLGEDEQEDTDVDLEAIIVDSFSRACGESEDTAFVLGAGHSSEQPEGICNGVTVTRVVAVTGDTTTISHESMLKLMYGPPAQYRRNGVFIVHSQVELALMQLRSDAAAAGDKRGLFLWQPSVAAGKPNTYWGKPIYTQDDLTSTLAANADNVAIFGDVRSGYRIVDRRGMRVKRLIEKFSDQGMIGIQISRRVAGAVVRAPALRVLKMAAA